MKNKHNEINTLNSRIFTDAPHKNDNREKSSLCKSRRDATRRSIMGECGRSMTEMLGTLAIIGVLSVGSIAGYSYAMDKWRANTTINDVNLRAMDLLAQLSQGHIPNLDAWKDDKTIYPISLDSDNAPTNYYIKVEQVPFSVCNMIADMMPESVAIEVNNDTEHCADGENAMFFSYEGFDVGNGDGNTGACPIGTSTSGLGDYAFSKDAEGNLCYCINAEKWDNASSSCVPKCSSFTDCDRGEYCQFAPFNCPTVTGCDGVCRSLSECGEGGSNDQFWMSDADGNCQPDWWTAQDICAAQGMRMVSLEDVGCEEATDDECTSNTLLSIRSAGMKYGFWTTDSLEGYGAWMVGNFFGYDAVVAFSCSAFNNVLCHR